MTLGENKKIMLGLIEEYSPNNQLLTEDEDIRNRINLVYATNYQYLSQKKKILKTKTINIDTDTDNTMIEYSLPMDLYQFKRIVRLDENNNKANTNYYIVGKKIYVEARKGRYIIEYYAYPTEINIETKDNFTLEIDQDVQAILPYLVANDILKVDPSADYSAFYKEYQIRMQNLDTRRELLSIEIEEGII